MKAEDRQRRILSALIEDYIEHGEALSSQALVDKTNLQVSSATMRNDLMSLEKDGYVRHLHTSSGRIPTDRGYRFFVDQLMQQPQANLTDKQYFENALSDVSTSMDKMLAYSAKILGEISAHPVILVSETLHRNIVKFIQLVLLNVHQVMVVILNNYGENFEKIINVDDKTIDQETLNKMTEFLNHLSKDIPLEDLGKVFDRNIDEVNQRFATFEEMLGKIMEVLRQTPRRLAGRNIVIENEKTLLTFPEFQDIQTLKQILSVLENEKKVCDMFDCCGENPYPIQSRIGQEHKMTELQQTSLVFSDIEIGSQRVARIGVLGPTRMQYDRMIRRVGGLLSTVGGKIKWLFTE